MDTYRLKMKIGEHEFEAEGPTDVVQAQFEAFKQLIGTAPKTKRDATQSFENLPHLPLEKILKVEGRIVSLTAKCDSIDEAVLLILLGQKESRNNQEATGSEVKDGLEMSGYKLERIDRIMDSLSTDGSVITVGVHRGRRYRLSNAGLTKALSIAKEVVATVP